MVNWEVGGAVEMDGDSLTIASVTNTHVKIECSYYSIEHSRAFLDSAVLRGDAVYRSPGFLATQSPQQMELSEEPEIVSLDEYLRRNVTTTSPSFPSVLCLTCNNVIVGAVMRIGSTYHMDASCCTHVEKRTWSSSDIEKINSAGGKWIAFLSN